jgi:hypothetical protein
MMLSTLWLCVALVLLLNGHPLTAALLALPWFPHHRWEQRVIRAAQVNRRMAKLANTSDKN